MHQSHPFLHSDTHLNFLDRASMFMIMHLVSMLGNGLGPGIASAMMRVLGPWPVFVFAVSLMGFSLVGVLCLPEGQRAARQYDAAEVEPTRPKATVWTRIRSGARHVALRLGESLAIINSWSLVMFIAGGALAVPTIYSTTQFMAQYASKRFVMPIAQAGYLLSIWGLGNLVVILFVVPVVARLVRADATPRPFRQPDDRRRDLFMARGSAAFYAVGSLAMAAAPSVTPFIAGLLLMSVGSGFGSYVRSLVVLFVDAEHRTRLLSIQFICEQVGSVVASPFLAGLFTLGLKLKGFWVGLPYLGVGCLTFLSFLLLLAVRLPGQKSVADAGGDVAVDEEQAEGVTDALPPERYHD